MFFRKYWIPFSVFIITIVGVSLYVLQTRPQKDPILIVKPVEFKKPAAKAPVVEQPTEVGHFHEDGTWHEAAHTVQETNRPSAAMSEYSPEELQQIYDQFYIQHGLQPPPPGYEYRWADVNVPLLDENGNPILHKIGEPIVELEIRVGFAPTREEYERLDQLGIDEFRARQKGQIAKANEILKEIEALKASAQRERPFVKQSTWLVPRAEYERDPGKRERITRETLNAALRAYGLEHLIRP